MITRQFFIDSWGHLKTMTCNHTRSRIQFGASQACLLSILLLACLSPAFAVSEGKADPSRIQVYATEILQGILQGISEGDFEKYAADFADVMRKAVNRESFLQLQKNLQKKVGKFQSMDYMGFYVQEGQAIALFKARFSKDKDDVLVRILLDGHKAAPKVTGLWFDAPALRE
jgi:hypothetical protein